MSEYWIPVQLILSFYLILSLSLMIFYATKS